jgi:hypothetical protein
MIFPPYSISHNTMDHNSVPMSYLNRSPPHPPSGIDPEVLSKINALFETPEVIVTLSPRRLPTETTKKMEAWWTNTGAPSADRKVVDGVAEEEQYEKMQNGGQDQDENDEQSADVNSAADEEDDFESNDTDFFNPTSEDDIISNTQLYDLDNLPTPELAPISQPFP